MTREKISEGLSWLVMQLANPSTAGDVAVPPAGWEPYEWAYVRGLASAEILRLRARLFPVELAATGGDRHGGD